MINLIGLDRKKRLRAARRNSIWVRYTFLLIATLIAVSLILGGAAFYFYDQQVKQEAANKANQKKLFTPEYIKNKQAVTEFRKQLNAAKTIFNAETYYSAIILDVAKTMPNNTILMEIKFDSTTFQSQQILNFQAVTINDALALKTAFVTNPPLSSEVRFSTVKRTDPPLVGIDAKYPVKITMYMNIKKTADSSGTLAPSTGIGR